MPSLSFYLICAGFAFLACLVLLLFAVPLWPRVFWLSRAVSGGVLLAFLATVALLAAALVFAMASDGGLFYWYGSSTGPVS